MKASLFLLTLIPVFFFSCASMLPETESEAVQREMYQEEHQGDTQIMMDVVVNIEGIISEVSKDGKSFKLSCGTWVITDKQTKLGISGPNALPKEEQYFEHTFRKGNSIAGFSETPDGEIIVAQVIYTNWNWEEPIKR